MDVYIDEHELSDLRKSNEAFIEALDVIRNWAGNLPDDRLTSKTGPNDAALRGQMVVAMRQIANDVLNKHLQK